MIAYSYAKFRHKHKKLGATIEVGTTLVVFALLALATQVDNLLALQLLSAAPLGILSFAFFAKADKHRLLMHD